MAQGSAATIRFTPGQRYRRRELHAQYGGQAQSGISTPAAYPIIFLFTGATGMAHGYEDGWDDDVFLYTGEGQRGDMAFVRGNLAIRDHASTGRDLHLFAQVERGWVSYIGPMICVGFHTRPAPDTDGALRAAIVFELIPADGVSADTVPDDDPPELTGAKLAPSLATLRAQAVINGSLVPSIQERTERIRERSRAIVRYALARAAGRCEGCGQTAPFVTMEGSPYLEVHHLRRLADGGPDTPEGVAALCPTCHRRVHYAADGAAYNANIQRRVVERERSVEI